MADERYRITIYPYRLTGKKTTQKGVAYWQIEDKAKQKYRFYDEGLYNRIEVSQSYDVEVSDFAGSFVNEKGKEVEYTIKTIHNILSVPLDENEPLDKKLMENYPQNIPQKHEQNSEPDWGAIARGKVRNSVASAVITQLGLVELTPEMEELMEQWVEYIMNGVRE